MRITTGKDDAVPVGIGKVQGTHRLLTPWASPRAHAADRGETQLDPRIEREEIARPKEDRCRPAKPPSCGWPDPSIRIPERQFMI